MADNTESSKSILELSHITSLFSLMLFVITHLSNEEKRVQCPFLFWSILKKRYKLSPLFIFGHLGYYLFQISFCLIFFSSFCPAFSFISPTLELPFNSCFQNLFTVWIILNPLRNGCFQLFFFRPTPKRDVRHSSAIGYSRLSYFLLSFGLAIASFPNSNLFRQKQSMREELDQLTELLKQLRVANNKFVDSKLALSALTPDSNGLYFYAREALSS